MSFITSAFKLHQTVYEHKSYINHLNYYLNKQFVIDKKKNKNNAGKKIKPMSPVGGHVDTILYCCLLMHV